MSTTGMQCGIFMTPYNPPSRTAREVFDWAVDIARIADEAGYADYMIGEHYTLAWENIPMPEVIIAACAHSTKQIRFAPMSHLLPYHDPATLAIRIGWLSQIMEGRYFLGISPGGHHTDAILHGFNGIGELGKRQIEAMRLMERVWERKPFMEKGEFFQAGFPGPETMPEYHVDIANNNPFGGRDKLEVAVTGLSMNSNSMRFAQAQAIAQRATGIPGYDIPEVERRFLKALRVDGIDKVYPGTDKVPPLPNPKMEIENAKLQGKKMQLDNDRYKFILNLRLEVKKVLAQIALMEAQAAQALAGVDGTRAGIQLQAMDTAITAMKAHADLLDKQAAALESQGDNSAGNVGGSVSGMAQSAGNAGAVPASPDMEGGAEGPMG